MTIFFRSQVSYIIPFTRTMTDNHQLDTVLAMFERLQWIKDKFNTTDAYVTQTVMYRAWLQLEVTDALAALHSICWGLLNTDSNDNGDVHDVRTSSDV